MRTIVDWLCLLQKLVTNLGKNEHLMVGESFIVAIYWGTRQDNKI